MSRNPTYRGYDLEIQRDGVVIRHHGKIVCSQPSIEFARKWVDQDIVQRARAADAP